MGITSLFSKKSTNKKKLNNSVFTKDLLLDIVHNSNNMTLFFKKGSGWVGANRLFFDTFSFKDIADFKAKHENIRDMFLTQEDEFFVESDIQWLEYVTKNRKDGQRLTLYSAKNEILTINAKCHNVRNKKDFYILEFQNITKLKQAEHKTKEVEKLKARFLSNIGHEFRTPMNGLLGFIELLGQTDLDERQLQYLEMISRSSLNLISNIDTLLDYSQMQSGKLTLNNSSFFLNEIEQLVHTFYNQGKDNRINILTFIDPAIPTELVGDVRKVKQILNSLVQNAIKFTQISGKIIIAIKLESQVHKGECNLVFSVKDNGSGISNTNLVCPRDPLSPLSHADERTDVGLSLSYGLIDLLGSELELQTEKEQGTYFKFVLNFKVPKEDKHSYKFKKIVKVVLLDKTMTNEANLLTLYLSSFGMEVIKTDKISKNIYDGVDAVYVVAKQYDTSWAVDIDNFIKKSPVILLVDENEKLHASIGHIVDDIIHRPLLPQSILNHLTKIFTKQKHLSSCGKVKEKTSLHALVVEDNLINQKLLTILLQKYNILVSTAMDGNEAVAQCEKNSYDIVFMDIDMPNKNGIVATKEIKAMNNMNIQTPFVALTAMAMDGDKEMLIGEGLDDYMAKPLTLGKLDSMLNKYLKLRYI